MTEKAEGLNSLGRGLFSFLLLDMLKLGLYSSSSASSFLAGAALGLASFAGSAEGTSLVKGWSGEAGLADNSFCMASSLEAAVWPLGARPPGVDCQKVLILSKEGKDEKSKFRLSKQMSDLRELRLRFMVLVQAL